MMNTDFLKGIKSGVSKKEGLFLMERARECPARLPIIEIGSCDGGSTVWMGKGALAGNGAKIYAIDPHSEKNTWNVFLENIKRAGVAEAITPLKETSLDAHRAWDAKPVGFLWIDGDHSYEGVALDIELWAPNLVDGGIIAFHDVTHRWMGVYRAVKEKILSSRHYRRLGFANGILYATKTKEAYPIIPWLASRAWIRARFYLIFLKQEMSRVVKPIIVKSAS